MHDIFDDEMSAALAIALAYAEEIADEERDLLRSQQNEETLVPDEDAPEWYEED